MNGVPKAFLQSLLEHKKAETTEIYTKVFTLDVSQRAGVRFSIASEVRWACCAMRSLGHPNSPRALIFWVWQTEYTIDKITGD